jgi:threonyl-tRNA synthetase
MPRSFELLLFCSQLARFIRSADGMMIVGVVVNVRSLGGALLLYCLQASASYWRGRADRESLQRVYGISYPDTKKLKEYLHRLEEAKKRDHRKLGLQQELFFFHELSPGSCFFLPHGARIYNKLQAFIRGEYKKRGYEEVVSPNMFNMQLWETSGHAANYKENMFTFEVLLFLQL